MKQIIDLKTNMQQMFSAVTAKASRLWLMPLVVTTALLTSSCGGGLQLSEGGIGGSGISVGPITAFGSIYVNGVKYDVNQAKFTRNSAVAAGQSDFRIGEYVTVRGSINGDGLTGKADEVVYESALSGRISQLDTLNQQFEVSGVTVGTNNSTLYYGLASTGANLFSALSDNDAVEVSGVYNSAGVLVASSLVVNNTAVKSVITGIVSSLQTEQKQFSIGQQIVDYSQAEIEEATALKNGDYVKVQLSSLSTSALLAAATIRVLTLETNEGDEVEITGYVTKMLGTDQFMLDSQSVIVSDATKFEGITQQSVQLGQRLEVEGHINAEGYLVAEEVKDESSETETEEEDEEHEEEEDGDDDD